MKKYIALFLCAVLALGCLSGCQELVLGAVNLSQQAAQAAADTLKNQVVSLVNQHKVEVVEVKTAFGTIAEKADFGTEFLVAVLIRTESETAAQACAQALETVLKTTGYAVQEGQEIELELLCFQELSYDHEDFSDGTYYTVYGYIPSVLGDTDKK